MSFQTFGVVGYGNFGRFLATSLAAGEHRTVTVTDTDVAKLPGPGERIRSGSVEDVAASDVVILAVPFAALRPALDRIRGCLAPATVVMDVVSTKSEAARLLSELLPGHPNLLATHPLFGPPSMERIAPGERIVVTHQQGDRAAQFVEYLRTDLGLSVEEVSSEDHDRAMAYMQSLPFFIARALVDLDILDLQHKEELGIPSFEKLLRIADIETHHTHEMFETSQLSNPYAAEARRRFIDALTLIQRDLEASEQRNGKVAPADRVAPGPPVAPFDVTVHKPATG